MKQLLLLSHLRPLPVNLNNGNKRAEYLRGSGTATR